MTIEELCVMIAEETLDSTEPSPSWNAMIDFLTGVAEMQQILDLDGRELVVPA